MLGQRPNVQNCSCAGRGDHLCVAGQVAVLDPRFGRDPAGATTRPAPQPGLGFECDKLDAASFDAHLDAYFGPLIRKVRPRTKGTGGGWTMLHIDRWEMGAQN